MNNKAGSSQFAQIAKATDILINRFHTSLFKHFLL